jgi:hypothetical protein
MNSNVIFPTSFQRANRVEPVKKVLYVGKERKENTVIIEKKKKKRLLDIEI